MFSPEDLAVTERPVDCGKLFGIEVLDHVIFNAKAEFYSFKEKGGIPPFFTHNCIQCILCVVVFVYNVYK